jgi:hypothetical protein
MALRSVKESEQAVKNLPAAADRRPPPRREEGRA